jgi:hypothetical protein
MTRFLVILARLHFSGTPNEPILSVSYYETTGECIKQISNTFNIG